MPIFRGVEVQRMLEENARLFSAQHMKQCLGRLNSRGAVHALGAEWETVVFNALSEAGRVTEANASTTSGEPTSQPDCLFHPDPSIFKNRLAAGLPETLLIEVTTVSDSKADKLNPREEFLAAFHRLLRKRKLPIQRFTLDVDGAMERKPKKPVPPDQPFDLEAWMRPNRNHGRMRLALPPKGDIDPFVKTHLGPWIDGIVRQPDKSERLDFDRDGVRFTVFYDPSLPDHGISHSGGYPSYTATYSIDDNPVAGRLEAKANQLSRSAHRDLCAGVILCDGGCDLLADLGGYGGHLSINLDAVVKNCFNHPDYGRISFVVTLSPFVGMNGWGRVSAPRTKPQLFINPNAIHPVGAEVMVDLVQRALCDNLPQPVNTAPNACHVITGTGGFPEGAPPGGSFRLPSSRD